MSALKAVGRPVSDATLLSMVEVYEASVWHEVARQDVPSVSSGAGAATTKGVDSANLLRMGKELLTVLGRAYSRHICKSDNEKTWMRATAKDPFIPPDKSTNATLADALDAMAVLANECCTLNYMFISELLAMCRNKTVRVMLCSMERLHALFMELLPNCKLRFIHQVDDAKMRYLSFHISKWEKKDASTWDTLEPMARLILHVVCFEDFLKGGYAAFIQIITDHLEGGESFVKRRMLDYVFDMLARKPEQEGLLMDLLVSKLLHEDNKMSSAASTKLNALLECQAGMKEIVVRRIGVALSGCIGKVRNALAFKSVKSSKKHRAVSLREVIPTLKGMYRCILFMSELQFTRKESKAISESLKVYTSLLSFIFYRGDSDAKVHRLPLYEYEEFSRIIRCISSGLERCIRIVRGREGDFNIFDYCLTDGKGLSRESVEEMIGALYRAAHKPVSFSTNIGLLSLISMLQPFESRFYNLLYERLLDLRMFDANGRNGLLMLVSKCLSGDSDTTRIAAFVKRLFQVSLSLVGSDVSIHISRICRRVISGNGELKNMLTAPCSECYISGKRDPRATEANKSHLWECYLNRISYHPSIVTENNNLLKAPKDVGITFESHTLFQDLGAISGQLHSGDFAYTQKGYWSETRKAEPHQLVFKQFYEYKSVCDFELTKKKPSTTAVGAAADELDDSAADELYDITPSEDEVSMASDDESQFDEVSMASDHEGQFDEVSMVSDDGVSDISDVNSTSDLTSSDEIQSVDESDFEDEPVSYTYAGSSSSSSSSSDEEDTVSASETKPRVKPRATALSHAKAPRSSRSSGIPKDMSKNRSMIKPGKAGKGGPRTTTTKKASEATSVQRSGRHGKQRKVKDKSDDPGREKRKKVSMLIHKATKGSFADASEIEGMEELL